MGKTAVMLYLEDPNTPPYGNQRRLCPRKDASSFSFEGNGEGAGQDWREIKRVQEMKTMARTKIFVTLYSTSLYCSIILLSMLYTGLAKQSPEPLD